MTTKVTPTISYIGVNDFTIDLFENQYPVSRGMSYNSHIIHDEKLAILDTVDARKGEEWLQNLEEALNGRVPDYLIVQHLEPDHSALIANVCQKYPQMILVGSAKAIAMLPQFFEDFCFDGRTLAVKEGDTLKLGRHTLSFIMAPMVHWPEVMLTYDTTEKVLFSADVFGKFGAIDNDQNANWHDEARRYYYNICGKYGTQVQALLKKVSAIDLQVIAPLHGPILTNNLDEYIRLYDLWSSYQPEYTNGILVAYASIHGGTAIAAKRMAQMLQEDYHIADVRTIDLCRTDVSVAVDLAFAYGKMILAASSYDASVFPPMFDFLHHLKLKYYQKRRVAWMENGSWAPVAGRIMNEMLEEMKEVDIVASHVTIRSRMHLNNLAEMHALAQELLE